MPFLIVSYCFLFFLGAAVFSFLNVVVYRLPRKLNYVSGHSTCPQCGEALKPWHNIPLVSYVCLRGKCSFCKELISPRYWCFELLGGALSVFTFGYYVDFLSLQGRALLKYGLVFALLCLLTLVYFIDKDTMEIPNGLPLLMALLGIGSVFVFPEISLLERGIGILAVSLPFFLIDLVIDGAFGGGDIKLMAAAGVFLGWQLSLVALFIALLLGGGYGAYLLLTKKKDKKDHVAFGPFLTVGIAAAWFVGPPILTWYLGFFSFM